MFSALEDINRKPVLTDEVDASRTNEGTTKEVTPSSSFSRIHLPPIVKKDSTNSIQPSRPEIKILCMKCEEEISLRELQSHRELHHALSVFRYTIDTKPSTVKQLLKRRRALIKRLNETATSEEPVSIKKLHKVNLAYELLKSNVGGTMSTREVGNDLQPSVRGFSTRLSCALAFGVCEDRNERWRTVMEDRYSYQDYFCNDPQSGFFAVFDGYSGPMAAEKCARYFHEILADKIEPLYRSDMTHNEVVSQVIAAFKDTYEQMDKYLLLGVNENSRNRWSGCSALTCLLRGNSLYVANAGNVKAMLCKGDGSIVTLSRDHSPWNKRERNRVKKATDITRSERSALVNGMVTCTRGLGNHGDPVLKSAVINQPYVNCVSLDDDDQFLILASNGIWEVFSDEEVLLLLDDIMPEFDVKAIVRRIMSKKAVNLLENSKVHEGKSETTNGHHLDSAQSKENIVNSRHSIDGPSNPTSNRTTSFINKEETAVALAKALCERLVESTLLAGGRENLTVSVVLLKGFPIQMFLLPSI